MVITMMHLSNGSSYQDNWAPRSRRHRHGPDNLVPAIFPISDILEPGYFPMTSTLRPGIRNYQGHPIVSFN